MKDLSVIIVNWNGMAVIPVCLDSLLRCTSGLDYEVIIVDNGSTDGSLEWIQEHHSQVQLIKNSANLGFSSANNQAIRVSTGRNVVLLNPDTELRDNALKMLCDRLDADPNMGACGGLLLYPDGQPQWSFGYYPSLPRMLWITVSGLLQIRWGRKPHAIIPELNDGPCRVEYICGADLMIKRSVLDRVGLLDESFFAYCEETDLCERITRAGHEIWYYPDAQIIHHIGETFTPWKARLYYTSLFRYCKKHHGYWRPVKCYLLAKRRLQIKLSHDDKQREEALFHVSVLGECGLEYFP